MVTPVQGKNISIAIKAGRLQLACWLALLASTENGKTVYLPNAYSLMSDAVTPKQWAGYLSALQQEGKYRASQDPEYAGYWGYIVASAIPAHIAQRRIGPSGWITSGSGETVARSYFQRDDSRAVWQWFAMDPSGAVINVSEVPFSLRDVCDSWNGQAAASVFVPTSTNTDGTVNGTLTRHISRQNAIRAAQRKARAILSQHQPQKA